MKVGDLVKCITADERIGIITEISLPRKGGHVYTVLVLVAGYNKSFPFQNYQLEVINESR
jgi:hypothetical protein